MDFNYLQRVKVYRLNDDGKWDDKGTGHVSVEYLERSNAVGLVVIDEDDNATLLVHRVSADDIYQRQEDTIISWTDPEVATDLALSFQETMGCAYIWDQICSVQRQIQVPTVPRLDGQPRNRSDNPDHSGTSQVDEDSSQEPAKSENSDLPTVDLNSLPQIVKLVSEVSLYQRDRVASTILRDQSYVEKILELFRVCEDLENVEGLHQLYKIAKGLILLNDGHLFDIIFGEDLIMDLIGALEYDPEAPEQQQHRVYLKQKVVYKEAVAINDPSILSKIHQTYRIGYIKDVILPRVLDDQTNSTLNSLMLFNNLEVVTGLHMDNAFMTELFSRLLHKRSNEGSWKDLIQFLQEFCNLHKHLPPTQRNQYFGELISSGLYEIVTTALQHSDEEIRLSGVEVLMSTVSPDPNRIRDFLVQQTDHKLFDLLVKGMITTGEGGLQVQLLEMLRVLLDSDTQEGGVDKNKFLDLFYEKYIDQLVGALTAGCPPKQTDLTAASLAASSKEETEEYSEVSSDVLNNLCELLCFCVQHHSFQIKYYVLRKNVVEQVLRLIRRKEKSLKVAAVRFLRTCIGLKDDFYFRYLVKNNLFEPVIQAFVENGSRYNLLNSAIIELVDFIRKENISILLVHLMEKYWDAFADVDYVETFKLLKVKYDQSKEGPAATSETKEAGQKKPARRRKDERELDQDEEDYFNEGSDEEDTTSAPITAAAATSPPKLKLVGATTLVVNGAAGSSEESFRKPGLGLVDYEDEDDDSPASFESNGGSKVENVDLEEQISLGNDNESPGKRRRLQLPLEDGERDLRRSSSPQPLGTSGKAEKMRKPLIVMSEEFDEGEWFSRAGNSPRVRSHKGADKKSGLVKIVVSRKDRDHGSRMNLSPEKSPNIKGEPVPLGGSVPIATDLENFRNTVNDVKGEPNVHGNVNEGHQSKEDVKSEGNVEDGNVSKGGTDVMLRTSPEPFPVR